MTPVLFGWYLLASFFTFLAYGWDKGCAAHQRRRVRERTLQLMALFGGFPGAWAGQQVFHHKRRKRDFMLVFWGIVAVHVAFWGTLGWCRLNGGL